MFSPFKSPGWRQWFWFEHERDDDCGKSKDKRRIHKVQDDYTVALKRLCNKKWVGRRLLISKPTMVLAMISPCTHTSILLGNHFMAEQTKTKQHLYIKAPLAMWSILRKKKDYFHVPLLPWTIIFSKHSWKSIRGLTLFILATFIIIKPPLLTSVDAGVIPKGAWCDSLFMPSYYNKQIIILQSRKLVMCAINSAVFSMSASGSVCIHGFWSKLCFKIQSIEI